QARGACRRWAPASSTRSAWRRWRRGSSGWTPARERSEPVRVDAGLGEQEDLVLPAVGPLVARLEGLHDRMPGLEEVPQGVAGRGGVAAPDLAAGQAEAQRHPRAAALQAAAAAAGPRLHLVDLQHVGAD